jgi:hypothetical protein
MKIRTTFLAGAAVGYVLGAKAGRERYEQIRAGWAKFSGSPTVREKAETLKERGAGLAGAAKEKADALRRRHDDAPGPVTVPPN